MFDLAVSQVKVLARSLFELSWYYFSTQCYISNFTAIRPLIPKKKIFKSFYHGQAWRPCWSCDLDCFLSAQECSIRNLLPPAQGFLRRCFKLSWYESPKSKVKQWPWPPVLTTFHVLIRQRWLPTVRPKSSKFSMKSFVLAFSHNWPCRKIGQGQSKIIIWTILIVLK